jgi:hypothetical protein
MMAGCDGLRWLACQRTGYGGWSPLPCLGMWVYDGWLGLSENGLSGMVVSPVLGCVVMGTLLVEWVAVERKWGAVAVHS